MEFVAAQACKSEEEVRRFYERQGAYLALLYALEATDFHSENLIAAGEHPVLLDLEALFHPRVGGIDLTQAEQLAGNTMNYSVLRVGLLPNRIWSNDESVGIDLSGLGSLPGQLSPRPFPRWEGSGTDEMRLTRKRVEMPGGHNRPTLNGAEVNVLDYTDAILTGFNSVYGSLLKYRDDLLSDQGPLAPFADDEVSAIMRPTQTYAVLQRESLHPDVLRDALDRDRLFDHLWAAVEYCPHLTKVIPAEHQDLQNGDIPIFSTRPNSRDLWTSSRERIADFFDEPGIVRVRRRIQELGDRDCTQQLWFIRASLATLSKAGDGTRRSAHFPTEASAPANRERLLLAARRVGDRLEELALRGEQDCSWIGLTLANLHEWSLAPLGLDLYDGLPGVALFLAYLGEITGESRYATLAKAALSTVRREIKRSPSSIASIGGFDGGGGVAYALMHLGRLWNQPDLLTEAEAMVERILPLIEKDERFDVIGGAAGCIASLLALYRCVPSDHTLAAAVRCGDHLLAHALPMQHGLGWLAKGMASQPLAGFSHGAAGIAWALLELAGVTGEERFRSTALAAIEYERSLFSLAEGNWPDLRELEVSDAAAADNRSARFSMLAWCHGAPGIGLVRLLCLRHLGDLQVRVEINVALAATLARGFGGNHSLCHGDLGNLELLLAASLTLGERRWEAQVNRIAALVLESIEQNGWLCGNPLAVESPGLMTGLAGIGYELLRLAEPTVVPSVLALAPPNVQAAGVRANCDVLAVAGAR
jgi:type 2 lantibiotic biosynthesis protein LanM